MNSEICTTTCPAPAEVARVEQPSALTEDIDQEIVRIPQEPQRTERDILTEQWRRAEAKFTWGYDGGSYRNNDGRVLYFYPRGDRLEIIFQGRREQVMDSCEIPWCIATVNELTKDLHELSRKPKFLVRGFGLGIDSTLLVKRMSGLGGGEIDIIELNDQVADYAQDWKSKQERALILQSRQLLRPKPDVTIRVYRGDAGEVTAQFVGEKRKYDGILSDTYPFTEEEQGINDLLDLENLNQLLVSKGRLGFFAHFPGSTGGVYGKQGDLLFQHGFKYTVDYVSVRPPPDYRYLHKEDGTPVRTLPVVVAWKRQRYRGNGK